MSALAKTDEVQNAVRLSSQDRLLSMIQEKHPGYHPVLSMVQIAIEEEQAGDEGDRALAFACHKEVAKYVVQVDRMTEIKSEVVKTKRVVVEMFGEKPQELPNDPSPVLAAGAVVDAEIKRTVVQERGPVEESEEEAQPRVSVQVMAMPTDDARGELSMVERMS